MGGECDGSAQLGLNGMNVSVGGNMFKIPNQVEECFYTSGWDPIVPMGHPNVVFPFGVPGGGQDYVTICPGNFASSEYRQLSEDMVPVASPLNPNMTAEVDAQQDLSGETSEPNGSDEKKWKIEQNTGADQLTKQTGKRVKDDSDGGETTPKEDYVHMRARRGQATNSHSLAERVRREKISERMRALQELVPGCSKITGKAVMLDEIINYVQSLQQQVEFLSMKLATVNPELNFDINRILSKDILQLRGGDTPLLGGFNPGTSSSHPYAPGIHQGAIPGISTTPTYLSLPQRTWDGQMQGLFHTGFDSNPALTNLRPHGSSRPEP